MRWGELPSCHFPALASSSNSIISGPENVETICSAKIPVAKATTIKKGSPVRILKLFEIAAIDASYSDAKLQIVDKESKAVHIVYVKWPGSKALLTTESAGLH